MLEYKPYYLKPYLKSSHYKTYNMLEYKPYYLKPYLKSSHYKTWFHQQLFSFSTDRKYKEYTTSIHSQKISFKKHLKYKMYIKAYQINYKGSQWLCLYGS